MNFDNQKSGNGGVIVMTNENAEEVGRLTYTLFPERQTLVISYVMVHPQFKGRGMGKFLVQEGISFARENAYAVVPHCSYARSVMLRMPDVSDVFRG